MKQRTDGTRYEFTKRGYFEAESFDEGLDLIQGAAEGKGNGLADLERLCRNVLAEAGLPSDDRMFAAKPDKNAACGFVWRESADAPVYDKRKEKKKHKTAAERQEEKDARRWRLVRGVRYLTQGNDPLAAVDSKVGYASRILDCILRAREAQSAGDLDGALDWAAGAGALANESDLADWYATQQGRNAQKKWQTTQDIAEHIAEREWNRDPTLRIGVVAQTIQEECRNHDVAISSKLGRVKDMLKRAENEGRLAIPPQARRPGAPRKR